MLSCAWIFTLHVIVCVGADGIDCVSGFEPLGTFPFVTTSAGSVVINASAVVLAAGQRRIVTVDVPWLFCTYPVNLL